MRESVALQSNYLRNVRPPGPGICGVCRAPVRLGYRLCVQCGRHRQSASGQLADGVVPMAYAVADHQLYSDLVRYKAPYPVPRAKGRLRALATLFLHTHLPCLARAAEGPFDCVAVVPSTKGRVGQHPLEQLVAPYLPLPFIHATASDAYASDDRNLYVDRFRLTLPISSARVLVLDDTWTTGGRAQALSCSLRGAGATAVVICVVGRLLKSGYGPTDDLLAELADARYDVHRCAAPECLAA